jgi:O-antigen/teichoic acid export membrane protein
MMITIFFTTTGLLILPFVDIYTRGVTDVNYHRTVFAILLVLAEAAYCLRNPYSTVVFAAGHFKQTTKGAYVEAAVNIVISVILVNWYGIIGVAIGTLTAMLLRTFQYVYYLSKNILYRPIWKFVKELVISAAISLIVIAIVTNFVHMDTNNYFTWFIYALPVLGISAAVTIIINWIFYPDIVKKIFSIIFHLFKKKKGA